MTERTVDTGGVQPLPLHELPSYLSALARELSGDFLELPQNPEASAIAAVIRRVDRLKYFTGKLMSL